ncbi:MAG: aspartate-semialdehyde dehydrogenase [Gloeomargaritaceae cyanobacterium C42_A2020_066]|nr:aspartate-semialdehyde dehydrogenase [Gloeomargaritaceae cyanobacterium C42_A2020_066]
MSQGYRVAILGATGAVGAELLAVLEQRRFPVAELRLLASERSAGRQLSFAGTPHTVQAVTPEAFQGLDLVLASAGASLSKTWAPQAVAAGAVVIDNSSAFRLDLQVPLVVPEVNPEAVDQHHGVIANPNCTTAILVTALAPLHRAFIAQRVIVSTYQSASGAGARGMDELLVGTRQWLAGETVVPHTFAHPLPFNVIPHIDTFQSNGYTREEMKVVLETRKILGDSALKLSCTAVRVPTLRVHSEAVTVEFGRPVTPEAARQILAETPGIEVIDDPAAGRYPLPLHATGRYPVEVGRLRASLVFEHGLDFFIAGDQLLKGAALNAVQIAETLIDRQALVRPAGRAPALT